MIVAVWQAVGALPANFGIDSYKRLIHYPKTPYCLPKWKSSFCFKPSIKCHSFKNKITDKPTEGFSVLSSDIPWESGSIWSTMALYMFNLHIPLGIGGLSIVAYVLHQPVPGPQTEALSLLVIQILELTGALFLLRSTAKPEHDEVSFFKASLLSKKRNWLLLSFLGFGFLISLVFLTSLLADQLIGPKVGLLNLAILLRCSLASCI